MKSRIYVTQKENDKFFGQKLPTFRDGFCYIERKVTIEDDPHGVYDRGEYGYFTAYGKKIFVQGDGKNFDII